MPYLTYHIFTNDRDEWTRDIKEARRLFAEYVLAFGCARLYEEEREEGTDEILDENCIEAVGAWPQ